MHTFAAHMYTLYVYIHMYEYVHICDCFACVCFIVMISIMIYVPTPVYVPTKHPRISRLPLSPSPSSPPAFSPSLRSLLHYGGNICPFDLAIVMLCIAFPTICYTWHENYGSQDSLSGLNARASPVESFKAAWKAITSSWKISVLGIICACFEGSMYTFVINWTPTLAVEGGPPVPHGLIFSAMMMCCMVGSSVFSFLNPRVNPAKVIGFVSVLAALAFAFIFCVD